MIARPLVLTLCCSCSNECKYHTFYDWGFSYSINPDQTTPAGIKIDATGQQIDFDQIDVAVKEVEDCLDLNFPNRQTPSNAWCSSSDFEPFVSPECLTIKVPDDWSWSCNGEEQLLKDDAPQEGCEAKRFRVDADCPCKWRGGIQDNTIILTPNLRMLKDILVEFITGCGYIYADKRLKECVK